MFWNSFKTLAVFLLVGGVVVFGFLAVYNSSLFNLAGSVGAQERQPEPAAAKPNLMHTVAALQELRAARAEITSANSNFNGRRDEAVRDIDKAIGQLERLQDAAR